MHRQSRRHRCSLGTLGRSTKAAFRARLVTPNVPSTTLRRATAIRPAPQVDLGVVGESIGHSAPQLPTNSKINFDGVVLAGRLKRSSGGVCAVSLGTLRGSPKAALRARLGAFS